MPRLGEILIDAGLVMPNELEQALRAQVVWGGRLGTNLIELGFGDLDELSRALGKQHGLPAALSRHFEAADPALQRTLSAEIADRYSFVPLLGLADNKIALAGMDPLGPRALHDIAIALGTTPENLVLSVACEQRMRYQLERVYNIARAARYKRARGHTIPPFPQFGDFSSEQDSDVDVNIDATKADAPLADGVDVAIEWDDEAAAKPVEAEPPDTPTPAAARTNTDAMAALIDNAVATKPDATPSTSREQRSYVRTLAEGEATTAPPPKAALGRIAIRRVAVGGGTPPSGVPASASAPTLADAARAIRRSVHRDHVAELVVDALDRFAPNCDAAVMLIIRGASATAWKHFKRGNGAIPEVAVPLDAPGLVPQAVERAATVRAPVAKLGEIDRRLLAALGESAELAIVPVAIAGRVLCVIAVATSVDAAIPNVETIATAAGTAFARLLRDAGR